MTLRLVEISLPETDQRGAEALLQGEARLGTGHTLVSLAKALTKHMWMPVEIILGVKE